MKQIVINKDYKLLMNTHKPIDETKDDMTAQLLDKDLSQTGSDIVATKHSEHNTIAVIPLMIDKVGSYFLKFRNVFTKLVAVETTDSERLQKIEDITNQLLVDVDDVSLTLDNINDYIIDLHTTDITYSYVLPEDSLGGFQIPFVKANNDDFVGKYVIVGNRRAYITEQTDDTLFLNERLPIYPMNTKVNILNADIEMSKIILEAVRMSSLGLPSKTI